MDKDKILVAASYYLNNDVSLEETANFIGIKSKKTLNKYFVSVLKESTDSHERRIYHDILLKKVLNELNGRKKGGNNGTRTSNYNNEDVQKLYNFVIEKGATYRDAAFIFGIPRSTVYEMLHSSYLSKAQQEKIKNLASLNKVGRFIDEEDETNNIDRDWNIK